MKNWAKVAKEALKYFKLGKREDETEYWHAHNVPDEPEWIRELCYSAHKIDDVLPNDYIYEYIVNALELISEMDGAQSISEFEESIFEIEGLIYNHDLLKWVSSNLTFSRWVDEAMTEYGAKEHFAALQLGNMLHQQAIARDVLDSIDKQAEEIDETIDEEGYSTKP